MRLRSVVFSALASTLVLAACGGGEESVIKGKSEEKGGASGKSAGGGTAAGASGSTSGGSAGKANGGAAGALSGGASGQTSSGGAGSGATSGGAGSSAGAAGKASGGGASGSAGATGGNGSGNAGNGSGNAGNGSGNAGNGSGNAGNGSGNAGNGSGNAGNGSGNAGNGSGNAGAGGTPSNVCTPACAAGSECVNNTCAVINKCEPACGGGFECVNNKCVVGSSCGREDIAVTRTPPNVLLTLDRSCSMKDKVGGQPKWTSAVNGMVSFTTKFDSSVRFGLELFPDTDDKQDCKMGDPLQVAVGANTAAPINALLKAALKTSNKYYPDDPCTTPIDWAVVKASMEPALQDGVHKGFMVLITDGAQSSGCGGGGDPKTTATIKEMKAKGIGTFVVSFGNGAEIDEDQLTIWANDGGYPNAASTNPKIKFYQAGNQTELDGVLSTIAEAAVSCDFKLAKVPPDLSKLFVFTDGENQLAKDPAHTKGWDYDAASNTVSLYGAACSNLKKGISKDVNVVYGCSGTTGGNGGAGGTSSGGGTGGSGTAGAGGGGLGVCPSGKPKCNKDNLCPVDDGVFGLCTDGCCVYVKD